MNPDDKGSVLMIGFEDKPDGGKKAEDHIRSLGYQPVQVSTEAFMKAYSDPLAFLDNEFNLKNQNLPDDPSLPMTERVIRLLNRELGWFLPNKWSRKGEAKLVEALKRVFHTDNVKVTPQGLLILGGYGAHLMVGDQRIEFSSTWNLVWSIERKVYYTRKFPNCKVCGKPNPPGKSYCGSEHEREAKNLRQLNTKRIRFDKAIREQGRIPCKNCVKRDVQNIGDYCEFCRKREKNMKLLAEAKRQVAVLNQQRDAIYDKLCQELGTTDESSAIFDYVFNGYGRVTDVVKEI